MDPFTLGFSILGGLAGIFGSVTQSKREQEQLERQKETAWQQYLLGKTYSDAQWGIERSEAQGQIALQGRRLDAGVNQAVGQFNTGLLGQAYGIQDALIGTAASTGASLAAEGMSGTRGNGAGGLARAYEEAALARNAGLQGRENQGQLDSLVTQAGQAREDLDREKRSWESGGYRAEAKAAQDAYNRGIAKLGQSDFDWRIDQAAPSWENVLVGGIQGASSGWNFGEKAYDAWEKSRNSNNFGGIGGSVGKLAGGVNNFYQNFFNNFRS
ncbi:MAG: hypothetical protein LBQ35_07080 [Spirochaetaceae bacterium]|jgi:hypothetical protein|nr:hypothetical protein [Spirochaetaceae bacterium]